MTQTTPLARYQSLCLDAVDPQRLGAFWADTLGRDLEQREDGQVLLTGPSPQHTIWVNAVPEPVTVKQRVHLDVHAASVEEVLERGASAEDLTSFGWKLLRDPEGGELCVFERAEVPSERLYEVIVDAHDPPRMAAWWLAVLGGRLENEDGDSLEAIPGAPFDYLVFQEVPEPKTVKNRVHLDVDVADVGLLVEHGATVLREPDGDISWTVLADPEGNELCAFVS